MTLLEIMTVTGARVCGGCEYLWHCYGEHARHMDFADVAGNEYCTIVFDAKDQTVYEIGLHVPGQEQAFGWHNPATLDKYLAECKERNVVPHQAWDDVMYEQVDEVTVLAYLKDIGELYYDDLPVPHEPERA
jgi:hypothetical protein